MGSVGAPGVRGLSGDLGVIGEQGEQVEFRLFPLAFVSSLSVMLILVTLSLRLVLSRSILGLSRRCWDTRQPRAKWSPGKVRSQLLCAFFFCSIKFDQAHL